MSSSSRIQDREDRMLAYYINLIEQQEREQRNRDDPDGRRRSKSSDGDTRTESERKHRDMDSRTDSDRKQRDMDSRTESERKKNESKRKSSDGDMKADSEKKKKSHFDPQNEKESSSKPKSVDGDIKTESDRKKKHVDDKVNSSETGRRPHVEDSGKSDQAKSTREDEGLSREILKPNVSDEGMKTDAKEPMEDMREKEATQIVPAKAPVVQIAPAKAPVVGKRLEDDQGEKAIEFGNEITRDSDKKPIPKRKAEEGQSSPRKGGSSSAKLLAQREAERIMATILERRPGRAEFAVPPPEPPAPPPPVVEEKRRPGRPKSIHRLQAEKKSLAELEAERIIATIKERRTEVVEPIVASVKEEVVVVAKQPGRPGRPPSAQRKEAAVPVKKPASPKNVVNEEDNESSSDSSSFKFHIPVGGPTPWWRKAVALPVIDFEDELTAGIAAIVEHHENERPDSVFSLRVVH